MKHPSSLCLLGACLATAAFAGIAVADVAPPDDYVEDCTLALQQKPGEDCVECQATYFDDPNPCEEQYEPLGYSQRCSTWGTSHTEIWCKGRSQGAAGSAGSGNAEEGVAGAGAEGGAASARPGPSSGGAQATGGKPAPDPMVSGGGPSTGGASNTGGETQPPPTATEAGGSSTTGGASEMTQPTATGGADSAVRDHEDGGCSLSVPGRGRGSILFGLGIALALLGRRKRT